MRGKREGPCRVQGPRGACPGPGGPPGAPPHRTRPAATAFAAPVARQNWQGPSCGVPHMPGVPPAPQPLMPRPQIQVWPPATGLPPTPALWARPGIRDTSHRHWLRPPPASGPGQGLTSVARKKVGANKGPGRGRPDPSATSTCISSPGRPGPGHTVVPGQEPQVCKPSLTKLHSMFRASPAGAKAGRYLPKGQAPSYSKEACFFRVQAPQVASLALEPRRLLGAAPPNPTLPTRPQISHRPRDTLKGWLAGSQVCGPVLNPGSPLWSLLSPG